MIHERFHLHPLITPRTGPEAGARESSYLGRPRYTVADDDDGHAARWAFASFPCRAAPSQNLEGRETVGTRTADVKGSGTDAQTPGGLDRSTLVRTSWLRASPLSGCSLLDRRILGRQQGSSL